MAYIGWTGYRLEYLQHMHCQYQGGWVPGLRSQLAAADYRNYRSPFTYFTCRLLLDPSIARACRLFLTTLSAALEDSNTGNRSNRQAERSQVALAGSACRTCTDSQLSNAVAHAPMP